MSDDNETLPDGEKVVELAEAWYRQKNLDLPCAACGQKLWQVGLHLVAAPCFSLSGQPVQREGFHLTAYYIPAHCEYCGYTVFFFAQTVLDSDSNESGARPSLRLVKKEEEGHNI